MENYFSIQTSMISESALFFFEGPQSSPVCPSRNSKVWIKISKEYCRNFGAKCSVLLWIRRLCWNIYIKIRFVPRS